MDKKRINFYIGILLALIAGLFAVFNIGETASRIAILILGIILIAINSPNKK